MANVSFNAYTDSLRVSYICTYIYSQAQKSTYISLHLESNILPVLSFYLLITNFYKYPS